MRIENWNESKILKASKLSTTIEIEKNGRNILFMHPYGQSVKMYGNEKVMLYERKLWSKANNNLDIFNRKNEWVVFDVTACRTEKRRSNESSSDFLSRTSKRICHARSIYAAVKRVMEYNP